MWNSVDPDETAHYELSHLDLRCLQNPIITKTYLYNFDPLKPHFYIVKMGFTGVYIIFHISAQNIYFGYSLEPPRRGGSNRLGEAVLTSTHNVCFVQEYEKYLSFFYLKIFSFWRWNFLYIWIGVFS